jgi:tRNA(Ile)-lysidine synthase
VDDDSNDNDRFARNRLRLRVWPALVQAFADAETTLAAAAERAQSAATVLDEVAALDLATIADGSGLDLAAWRRLSSARQQQALLRWLHHELGEAPPASLVERLMREALASGPERRWQVAGGELRSHRGRLRRVVARWSATGLAPIVVDLSRPGRHEVPGWHGAFHVDRVDEGGIAVAAAARLELRSRAPGDRFQAGARRPPRSLKLQFQAKGIESALRDGPVVCRDGVPVFVAGLGLDARALAQPGEAQVALTWLQD